MFIPAIPQESRVDFKCNDGASVLSHCSAAGAESNLKQCIYDTLSAGNRGNATLSCTVSCDTEDWMWDVICSHWNVSAFCKSHNHDDLLQFEAITGADHFSVEKDCLHLIVKQGNFPTNEQSFMNCPGRAVNASARSIATSCDIECNNSDVNEIFRKTTIDDNHVTGLYQFWLFFMFLALSWMGMAVVVSVGDAICFEMLEDKPHLYGNQRLWGAIGWGSVSLISGLLVDEISRGKSYKDYSVVFYIMLILMILDMLVSKKLKHTQTKLSVNIIKDVGSIFSSVRIVIFFCWCIVVGLCTALVWNFLFWHLEDLAALQEG